MVKTSDQQKNDQQKKSDKNSVNSSNIKKRRPKKTVKYHQLSINICPCGGGQSCIRDRRIVGDYVHEDDLFIKEGLPVRKNCFVKYSKKQEKCLENYMTGVNSIVFKS